jgi:hypothetical protein
VVKRKFEGGAPKNSVETTAGSKEEKEKSCIWSNILDVGRTHFKGKTTETTSENLE